VGLTESVILPISDVHRLAQSSASGASDRRSKIIGDAEAEVKVSSVCVGLVTQGEVLQWSTSGARQRPVARSMMDGI
jgi:hypothetical protein